jgi:hypothetical protein
MVVRSLRSFLTWVTEVPVGRDNMESSRSRGIVPLALLALLFTACCNYSRAAVVTHFDFSAS